MFNRQGYSCWYNPAHIGQRFNVLYTIKSYSLSQEALLKVFLECIAKAIIQNKSMMALQTKELLRLNDHTIMSKHYIGFCAKTIIMCSNTIQIPPLSMLLYTF